MTNNELKLDLASEVVVITGGGGVLCSAMAKAVARCGADVAILDINESAAESLSKELRDEGSKSIAVSANVLDREDIEHAAGLVKESLGTPTVLINGAGGNKSEATTGPDMEFFDLPADAARWVFDLNFLGTFLPSQVFGKQMVEGGKGNIINISSMNAYQPLTKIPAYSAAKAAVSNFTQWLAVHMSQNYDNKVKVNAIAPGFFLTEQNRFLLMDEKTGELTPRGATIINNTPMGKFGDPEDLTGTLLWLLSDSASFVHGIVVPVDGGFSAFGGV